MTTEHSAPHGTRHSGRNVARRLVHSAFNSLRTGEITITDWLGTTRLGRGDTTRLSANVHVLDPRFYSLVARRHSLGAAEAFIKGFWEADDLVALMRMFVRRIGNEPPFEQWVMKLASVPAAIRHWTRRNTRSGSRRNIKAHYDLGNDFFEAFLDPTMTYSCGVFETPDVTMEEASKAKLRLIARKLGLRPGMSVVEIGSGWGSFAVMAAAEYGCDVLSVTLSRKQADEANRRIQSLGLADRAKVKVVDYRDLKGQYDRLVSIEMIEAVGHARLPEFFHHCSGLLKPNGLALVQVITMPDQDYRSYLRRADFIQEFVFPGSCCPARTAVLNAAARASDLRAIDVQEIGPHYATTLKRWRDSFLAARSRISEMGYPDEFLRLWEYYLCYCEAGFAEAHVGDVQIVFSKPEFRGVVC